MKIGEVIYQRRKQMGLTQEELAERLNTSRQAVSKWELGESIPETDKLPQIATILNCSVDELLGREDGRFDKENPVESTVNSAARIVKRHWRKIGYYLIYSGVMVIIFSFVTFLIGGEFSGFSNLPNDLRGMLYKTNPIVMMGMFVFVLGVILVVSGIVLIVKDNKLNKKYSS